MKQNKKFYEPPHMEVVELKSRQTLLAGSGERGIQNMEEESIFDDSES